MCELTLLTRAGVPGAWIAAAWPSPTLQKGLAQVSKDLHETLARPEDGSMLHISLDSVSELRASTTTVPAFQSTHHCCHLAGSMVLSIKSFTSVVRGKDMIPSRIWFADYSCLTGAPCELAFVSGSYVDVPHAHCRNKTYPHVQSASHPRL